MSNQPEQSSVQLLKATVVAAGVAAGILIVAVLPAEYGIDPTGLGSRLGLVVLAPSAEAAELAAPPAPDARIATEASKSAEVFGEEPGQSFNLEAVASTGAAPRTDSMSVTLAPGKGAEVKALLKAGEGFVFHWAASGDVAVDMHGERPDTKDEYTSYWIEGAQREASGTFTAPFDGKHGWYWRNRSQQPITVQVTVTGFQQSLFRPGHP